MNNTMNRHISNMSIMSGGNGSTARYSYIMNTDDVIHRFNQMHEDLGYDLAIDSRNKRAIVYNKSGIEKAIREAVNTVMIEACKELGSAVADDVVNDIVCQLNSMMQLQNGSIVVRNSGNKHYNNVDKFANMLVKGFIRETGKIIEDIVSYDDKRK